MHDGNEAQRSDGPNSNNPRSKQQAESEFTPLAHARAHERPFPHFIGLQPFAPEVADAAYAWLDGHCPWRRHVESFFDQFEWSLIDSKLPPLLHQGLISAAALGGLRRRMEALFSVEFADLFSVTAHRLVPGQGIGLHTDRPLPGYESHRMVVHFGPEFRDKNGGHLLFFNSEDSGDLAKAVRTVHNSAVSFELSPCSYHAVAELASGVRYTLVYSFWRVDKLDIVEDRARSSADFESLQVEGKDTRIAPHAAAGATLDELVNVLVKAGAARRPTPESAVLPDMVHCYELLRSLGGRPELCLAGLFHGVYGTALAPEPLMRRTGDRERVREAIGEPAEALVHACAAADYESLKRALAQDDPSLLVDRWRAAPLLLDSEALADVATLLLAYRVARHARFRPNDAEWEDEQELLKLAEPHLDQPIRDGLCGVYR